MKKLIFAFIALSFSNIIFAQGIKKRIEIPQGKSTETHKAEVLEYVKSNQRNVLFVESFSEALRSEEIRQTIDLINKETIQYAESLEFAKHDEAYKKSIQIKESDLLSIFTFEGDSYYHFIKLQFKGIEAKGVINKLTSTDDIEDEVEDATMHTLYALKYHINQKTKKHNEKLQLEQFNLDGFSFRDDINDTSRDSIKDLLRKEKLEIIQGSKVRNV